MASLVASVALLGAAPSSAAPRGNALVDPGRAIGQVRIGMTLEQVTEVLGKPNVVNRRVRNGFGAEYVEYDWGRGKWTVGFAGRGERKRVALISTQTRRQRTPEGIGVGSTKEELKRAYRDEGLTCPRNRYGYEEACRLRGAGSETFFPVQHVCVIDELYLCTKAKTRLVVFEILIRNIAAPRPPYA